MRIRICFFVVFLLFSIGHVVSGEVESDVSKTIERACLRCHGPDSAEGDFRVDQLSGDFTKRDNASAWIEIRDRVNLGEMPPAGEPELSVDEITTISRWIAARLRSIEKSSLGQGRVLMRRLNRDEYTHTVGDLLAMQFPTGESPLDQLPPDGKVEGFDKVSAALLLDPSLMTQFYRVARRVAQRAIVDGPPAYPTERMRLEFEEIANSNAIRYLLERRGLEQVPGGLQLVSGSTRSFGMLKYPGRRDQNVAPVNGFYRFTVRAGGAAGDDGSVPRIRLTHKHPNDEMRLIMEVDVTAPWDKPADYSVTVPRDALGGELSVQMVNETSLYMGQRPGENFRRRNNEFGDKGDFAGTLRIDARKVAEGWGGDRSTPDPERLDLSRYPRVFLDYLEVEGPLYEQWPPKSHELLLGDSLGKPEDVETARVIFAEFLPRAWRRPIEPEEIEPLLKVVRTELDHGEPFHEALRVGLAVALTSPKFLFLIEPSDEMGKLPRKLTDYEVASRLSYFLWNSMPDDELFRSAELGKLTDEAELRAQVDRMLTDPKADRFVDSFARQWLRTDTFLAFTPDNGLYKDFDAELAEAVVSEPLEFFHAVLRDDLSVLNFIDSDFLVLNERLARHYEIRGVEGEEFRVVQVPDDSVRGGLLAMAGVHLAGADGIRTKPVSRAVYVREVLFNDPPDPPPANAGEVEPNIKGERLTVRERLMQHQQIKACASCHRSLDPYGLALENFNAVGAWRELQDGEDFRGKKRPPIESAGQLPNGDRFANFHEFRAQLYKQNDRFRRALAEKMLTYALGRSIEPADDANLAQAVAAMEKSGDTLRSLIQSLVTSEAFLSK